MAKGNRPTAKTSRRPLELPAPAQTSRPGSPIFCFRHIVSGYDVLALERRQQAALAVTLQQRAKLTWPQIVQADRHGQGTEKIPSRSIKPSVPTQFQDRDNFLVFRYDGTRPMVGVRTGEVFHVLWIERQYGEVYDHG
ncbi:MAG: hypothetical protein QG608_1318 [Actinomycetota bacterium]|nr:hypothetical protein [Actinomycetota bacterium]